MSEVAQDSGAAYEQTTEMYDSQLDNWQIVGSMPVEFAVRLTVWTPNESLRVENVLYWITSARVYSVIGYDISTKTWKEPSVPMVERLEIFHTGWEEWGFVFGWRDKWWWECKCLCWGDGGNVWDLTNKVPSELGWKLLGGNRKRNWESTKCVENDEAIWRKVRDKSRSEWEWSWVDGGDCIKGKKVHNCSIKGNSNSPKSCFFLHL